MSTTPPKLTDRTALERSRSRITPAALFLHEEARAGLQDRLSMVNKTFQSPAIVSGNPSFWRHTVPNARVIPEADVLDLLPDSHDLVIHAMALHWANDPVGQLIQCRRALQADGLFLCILFGGQTLNELRSSLADAEVRLKGGLSPRVAPMADIKDLGALLQRGGFALPVADSDVISVEYQDLRALSHDLRNMGESNVLAQRTRHFTPKSLFSEAEKTYLSAFPGRTKALRATFEMVTLTGWAPDASQQKPLRPGTAQTRLADALKTDETSLPD